MVKDGTLFFIFKRIYLFCIYLYNFIEGDTISLDNYSTLRASATYALVHAVIDFKEVL